MPFFKTNEIDWSLYAIVDRAWAKGRSLAEMAEAAITGGAGVVQLRDKTAGSRELFEEARKLQEVTYHFRVPLIINDRLDVALAVQADGVHLGQEDLPLATARRVVGDRMLIGLSASTLEEGKSATQVGADYLGVGAIFSTPTKPDAKVGGLELLRSLRPLTSVPIIAIGGINLENVEEVIEAGADGVAVISALLAEADIRATAEKFLQKIRMAKSRSVAARVASTGWQSRSSI